MIGPESHSKDWTRTRLIQFTTDWDEIVQRLPFYEQLFIRSAPYPAAPHLIGAVPIYRSFISQRALKNGGASDPIAARHWLTYVGKRTKISPKWWSFGLAVELTEEGLPTSYQVVDADGHQHTLPQHGLVIERDSIPRSGGLTFWPALRRFWDTQDVDQLTSVVLRVSRSGQKPNHRFGFEIVADATTLDLPAEAQIDLDAVLEELASPQRLDRYITPLNHDHNPWRR